MELNLISRVKQALNSGKYYRTCAEMPLYNFIKMLVTNNLSFIGKGSKKTLQAAWEEIFAEYMSLSNDTTQSYFLSIVKEITQVNTKLILIQRVVDELAKGYDKNLVECLKKLGFKYKYTPESLQSDLKLTVSSAKTLLLRLDERHKDLESLQSKGEVKESEYDALIVELSKYQGYRINTKEITVAEFVAIYNSYKEANKPRK